MLFTLLNAFMARLADEVPVFHENTCGWCVYHARVKFWFVLAMLVAFVAGIALGHRRGYARGLKDGNPFPRLRVGSPYWNWLARVFAE
jgi:hypothetical protein